MRRTVFILGCCLAWAAVLQASAAVAATNRESACEREHEIRLLARDALRRSGVAEGERPETEEVTCSGRIPRHAPLQVVKVRWDAVLRCFEIRLQCKSGGACLPFLVHLRPNPDDRNPTDRMPTAAAQSTNEAFRTLAGRDPSIAKAAHPSVRAGQTVTIFWEGGGMRITRTVVCLDSGSPGQQVRTRGQNGGRVVRAQVVGIGLVKALL
jgi:hypothetical protein